MHFIPIRQSELSASKILHIFVFFQEPLGVPFRQTHAANESKRERTCNSPLLFLLFLFFLLLVLVFRFFFFTLRYILFICDFFPACALIIFIIIIFIYVFTLSPHSFTVILDFSFIFLESITSLPSHKLTYSLTHQHKTHHHTHKHTHTHTHTHSSLYHHHPTTPSPAYPPHLPKSISDAASLTAPLQGPQQTDLLCINKSNCM